MNIKEINQQYLDQMRENFKLLRSSGGWTLEELAGKTGIPQDILRDMEEGGDFGVAYLLALCRFYHIKPRQAFEQARLEKEE